MSVSCTVPLLSNGTISILLPERPLSRAFAASAAARKILRPSSNANALEPLSGARYAILTTSSAHPDDLPRSCIATDNSRMKASRLISIGDSCLIDLRCGFVCAVSSSSNALAFLSATTTSHTPERLASIAKHRARIRLALRDWLPFDANIVRQTDTRYGRCLLEGDRSPIPMRMSGTKFHHGPPALGMSIRAIERKDPKIPNAIRW